MKTVAIRTKAQSLMLVGMFSIAVGIVASIGVCTLTSYARSSAFSTIQIGDLDSTVISKFGTEPSFRETSRILFTRYATNPCEGDCVERLWFENRLSFDTEAWSVELDKNKRVLKKSRWVSP
jgi:hypothetical protein